MLGVWLPAPVPTSRARLIGARFGRWREEIFVRARGLTLRYSLLLSVWVDTSAKHIFDYFGAFVHEPIVLSFFPPTCIGHTVAILLHDYWAIYDPPSTPLLYALHRTILVITISCRGLAATQYQDRNEQGQRGGGRHARAR